MTIAVVGIGQSMRGDDAVGLEAVRLWQDRHAKTAAGDGIRVETIQEPGIELLDVLEHSDAALIVDAVRSGARPGTLHNVDDARLSELESSSTSAHSLGVADVLRLGAALSMIPGGCRVKLLGIEAEQVDLGAGLSTHVKAALAGACEAIEREVQGLLIRS